MKSIDSPVIALASLATALCAALPARGQEAAAPAPSIESRPLFQAPLLLSKPGGGELKLKVDIQRRNLPRGARLSIPAGPGFTVVQLLAGKVQITSGGKTEKPAVDSFWLTGSATESVIESTSEAALIETFEAAPAQ